MMKKYIAVLLTVGMLVSMIAGCAAVETPAASSAETETEAAETETVAEVAETEADETEAEATDITIRLGGLKGPTSIGMVKLLDDAENGLTANGYDFTMAGSADELTPQLLKGELDILAVPANLGAILYNNSEGSVQMLAINTLGVIYLVENGGETVGSFEDLKGRTVYATGKGSTPEYAFRYLLSENGLDMDTDLTMEWYSEPSEIVAKMSTETGSVALLPQPYVTAAKGQLPELRVALDLTEAWDSLENGSRFITAGLIVRREFAETHPEAVKTFLEEYAASTAYVNENVQEASLLVEKYDIVKAAVAEKAIPECNIVCITGEEMKTAAEGYLDILFTQNAKAVGGALPEDNFYYE